MAVPQRFIEYSGMPVLIATQHKKEVVISPLLERGLGVVPYVAPHFDSDRFGTFSGEIERLHDPLTTLRNKCLAAMDENGASLALASEGSFGPHPFHFFTPANEEWVIFIDRIHHLEVVARVLSNETNYSEAQIDDWTSLQQFAEKVGFPEHGLILRDRNQPEKITKGISTWEKLRLAYQHLSETAQPIYVETDMRAMFNPTRMKVIGQATERLIELLNSRCKVCNTPGFTQTDAVPGLPCLLCNAPTAATHTAIFSCKHCLHREEKQFPHGKEWEDPMYCNYCNP